MAMVFDPRTNKTKEVKNLGWLITELRRGTVVKIEIEKPEQGWDCKMVATLRDGRVYTTNWASRKLCKEFIQKRCSFEGIKLFWFGRVFTDDCQ